MNRNLLILLVILLISLNVYLLINQSRNNHQFIQSSLIQRQFHSQDSSKNANISQLIKLNFNASINLSNNKILRSLGGNKVVMYLEEGVCGSCLIELLNYFEQLGIIIGKDKLLLLCNYNDKNNFRLLLNDVQPFIDNVQLFNEPNFPIGVKFKPIVFVVNRSNEVQLFYVPELYPEFKEFYFGTILPAYFANR